MRTIPFRGDAAQAIQKIQELWPRIRKNRIQVIAPAARGSNLDITNPQYTGTTTRSRSARCPRKLAATSEKRR